MPVRKYIVPIETRREVNSDGSLGLFIRAPWLLLDMGLRPHECMDFRDLVICSADVTNAQHTAISGTPGVFSFPLLDSASVSVASLRTFLNARGIPGEIIEDGATSRRAMFRIRNMCRVRQILCGRRLVEVDEDLPLNTQVSALTQARRDALRELAGRDLAGSETLRAVFAASVTRRDGNGAPA